MTDRPLMVSDLRHLLTVLREHSSRRGPYDRIDMPVAILQDTLSKLAPPAPSQQFRVWGVGVAEPVELTYSAGDHVPDAGMFLSLARMQDKRITGIRLIEKRHGEEWHVTYRAHC